MIHSSGRERARTEAAPSSALVVVVLGGISASREGGCVCGGVLLFVVERTFNNKQQLTKIFSDRAKWVFLY